MARLSSHSQTSPDPLALSNDDFFDDDCIKVTGSARIEGGRTPNRKQRTPIPRRGRVKPVVEIPSPKKRRVSELQKEVRRVRTPLATASPSSNRATPTPYGKTSTKRTELVTPTKTTVKTPVSCPLVPRSSKPTLASSIAKPLPTPSPLRARKRPRLSSPSDDTFLDTSPPTISAFSRETFLANEALRRQREARKFVYKGDADAPKLTRSGKVVGEVRDGTEEVDEYGGDVEIDRGLEVSREPALMALEGPAMSLSTPKRVPNTPSKPQPLVSLPASARPHVLQVLSTLTFQDVNLDSQASSNEEKSEALQGLVNLLRGTVERGEGNSALVVGARGVGKTRVRGL